jgi:hypothetical protein
MASRDGCLNLEYVADVSECKDDGVDATQVMLIANHSVARTPKNSPNMPPMRAPRGNEPRTRTRGVDAAQHAFPADALPQADTGGGVDDLASSPAAVPAVSRTTSGPGGPVLRSLGDLGSQARTVRTRDGLRLADADGQQRHRGDDEGARLNQDDVGSSGERDEPPTQLRGVAGGGDRYWIPAHPSTAARSSDNQPPVAASGARQQESTDDQ